MVTNITQDDTTTVFEQVKGCDREDLGLLPALLTKQGQNERVKIPGDITAQLKNLSYKLELSLGELYFLGEVCISYC